MDAQGERDEVFVLNRVQECGVNERMDGMLSRARVERLEFDNRLVVVSVPETVIVVAKSGDLAYEFSNSELSVNPRVWRKEAGQWKIAAQFAGPHYQEPTKL
jgi:hypothetical protein